jgi:pimeloyl-ACP methyl ester carboxylesterase
MADVARWVVVILLTVVAAAVWALLWVWLVRWWYRLRTPKPEQLRARCEDRWELAVHLRPAPVRRYEEPVLLCHGLAANRLTFDFEPPYSLAHVLAEAGFDCYSAEWRGTGHSRTPPPGRRDTDFSVDDHILQDGPALVRLALERSGARRAFWLGHSLGGLVGYAVAQGPAGPRLAGLIALGSPVFFRSEPLVRSLLGLGVRAAWPRALRHEWLTASLAPFLGYVPLPLSDVVAWPGHMPARVQRQLASHMLVSMSRKVLLQLQDWVAHDAFRSLDQREDWRAGLPRLTLPVLVLGGSKDKLAPPENLRAQYELVGSADKTLHVFGCERGDRLEYGHADLLFGTGAPSEVYPLLRAWLEAHATPLSSTEPAPLPASSV